MPGESTSIPPEARILPPNFQIHPLGVFGHTAVNGQVALTSNTNIPLAGIFDRDTVIDDINMVCEVKPSAARSIDIGYVSPDQTLAQPVVADNQWLVTALDMNAALTNGAVYTPTIDRTKNLLPAGARLFIRSATTADTALVGLNISARIREGIIR